MGGKPLKDETGNRFARWLVIGRAEAALIARYGADVTAQVGRMVDALV